ncbi:RelA/SpoT domain-containing protein [Dokdonella koreensis]|uniref:RelA/SpoT domain-containing protein n=1 Tax=Dokdonella koreensis DS-123 TaxID=1300342 RepID=A0A160DXT5_9GAMM|nr:RelA/SpoT domain-containing protein [Dokdonella koreensis]ANB18793.1 Hypothetical protein I596_2798 [Dokdonella koreensis DS-123]
MTGNPIPSLARYEVVVEPHRRALKRLVLEWDFFVRDVSNLNVFSVSDRVKRYERAVAKSALLDIPIDMLDDLAGLRVVVGTLAEVPIVMRFLTRQEVSKDLKIIKSVKIEHETGYRATHVVVEKRSDYQASAYPGRVEVQIHTIFQQAFNFLSRNWSYKQPWQVSPDWSDEFVELSRLLTAIDHKAHALHLRQADFQVATDESALTPYSYQAIVKSEFGEDIAVDDAVDACRMYVDLGYPTNAHLRRHFRDPRIADLYTLVECRAAVSETSAILAKMGRSGFWSSFGIKIGSPDLKKFFQLC